MPENTPITTHDPDHGIAQIQFAELHASKAADEAPTLVADPKLLLQKIKIRMEARVGWAETTLAEITSIKAGEVIALSALVDDPVQLIYEGHLVARGELVAVGDNLGIRIIEVAEFKL